MKRSSVQESHPTGKFRHKLVIEDDNSETLYERTYPKKALVLAQDTEEQEICNARPCDQKVEDSFVPDTEGFKPRGCGSKAVIIPDSLVPDTQEAWHRTTREGSKPLVPDSFVPDSETTESSKKHANSSHTIPDSFVPESTGAQSTLVDSTSFEIDSIPDSQGHLILTSFDKPSTTTVEGLRQEQKTGSHKPGKKGKQKKVPVKLFDQLEFSSDSSFDNDNHGKFTETFCVVKAETFNGNPLGTSDNTKNITDVSSRLSKNTNTKQQKKTLTKKERTKVLGVSESNSNFNRNRKHKWKNENKENRLIISEEGKPAGKKLNILEIFQYTSGSEEETQASIPVDDSHLHNITGDSESSDASVNGTKQLDATVIDELSQRLTNVMSKVSKKQTKSKEEKRKQRLKTRHLLDQQPRVSGKNISLQIPMMPNSDVDGQEELASEECPVDDSPVREACNMSVQVSMLDDSANALEESAEATSPVKCRSMSLQVSIADSEESEPDKPEVTTKNVSLQVSMVANQSSDDGEDNSAGSRDLALQISVISDSSLQDAQRDSLFTSDNDDTLLSNESSAQSHEGEKTVFQTPPEELHPNDKASRNVSCGASPTLTAYKTTQQNLDTANKKPGIHKRKSIGFHSSSFCVPSSAGSPDDVCHQIPHMTLSDNEDDGTTVRRVRSEL